MCRLFVFAKADNDHPDPDQDWKKYKRGDVIDVLEDGVSGGKEAEASGLFTIIELPGVPASDLRALAVGDPAAEGEGDPNFYPRMRVNRLDLDALEAGAERGRPIASTRALILANRRTVAQTPKTPTLKL